MIRNYIYDIDHTSKRLAILCLMLLAVLSAAAQDEYIRVIGQVVNQKTGKPITSYEYTVNIIDAISKKLITTNNEEGKFNCNMRRNSTLIFQGFGLKSKTVKLNGQTELVVPLELVKDPFIQTDTAYVKPKTEIEDIILPPGDSYMNGNWYKFTSGLILPRNLYYSNHRAVLQPVVYNSTRDTCLLGTPIVFDAKNYNRTQQRLYAFEIDSIGADPLAKYIIAERDSLYNKEHNYRVEIIRLDSVYLDNPKDECYLNMCKAQEDYRNIIKRDTTVTSYGVKNPLRWFDFNLTTTELNDSAYYPNPEIQPMTDKGDIDLRFPNGKDIFDVNDPHNSAELEKIVAQAQAIQSDKDNQFETLNIAGSSSPDGGYQLNLNLSKKRMDKVIEYIKGQIPEKARRGMKFNPKASVASWHDVAELMRKDSLYEEAEMVEKVDAKFKDPLKSRTMRKLEFYDELLEKKYLPMLRKVTYEMSYTIKRQLTIPEIKKLYNENYKRLSRYEFFVLSRAEQDSVQREKILRQALEVHDNFTLAANDLSVMMTKKGEPDPKILEPYAGKTIPKFYATKEPVSVQAGRKAREIINGNQIAALIMDGQYTKADTLAFQIKDMEKKYMEDISENTRYILAINDIFNGRIQRHFEKISSTSKRNKVVLLLAMRDSAKDKEALQTSLELPEDEALTHYLRAICYNRAEKLDDTLLPKKELDKAIEMDPKLERIALNDGDVVDLLIDPKTGKRK